MPLSRHSVGSYPQNELTRNLSGNIRLQSSQLADPLWTDPGIKSEISVRELISASKKKRRRRAMNGRTFSKNPRQRGKSHHHLRHREPETFAIAKSVSPVSVSDVSVLHRLADERSYYHRPSTVILNIDS